MPVTLAKRLISTEDYHKMAEVGILQPDDKIELLNGEIIKMSPIGSLHVGYVNILDELLSDALGKKVHVVVQSPVKLSSFSEPEPDLVLLKRRKDHYLKRLPQPKDVHLIVEVADSTLEKDREVKAPLYAQANISEYWILNIPDEQLEIFTEPKDGKYQSKTMLKAGDTFYFAAFDLKISWKDIFILEQL
ncbi:MAG: Uma2 family endonuclease [Bacteroidota bacterium]